MRYIMTKTITRRTVDMTADITQQPQKIIGENGKVIKGFKEDKSAIGKEKIKTCKTKKTKLNLKKIKNRYTFSKF